MPEDRSNPLSNMWKRVCACQNIPLMRQTTHLWKQRVFSDEPLLGLFYIKKTKLSIKPDLFESHRLTLKKRYHIPLFSTFIVPFQEEVCGGNCGSLRKGASAPFSTFRPCRGHRREPPVQAWGCRSQGSRWSGSSKRRWRRSAKHNGLPSSGR